MRRIVLTEGEHKRLVDCVADRLADVVELTERYNLTTPLWMQELAAIKDKLAAAPREEA